MPTQNPKPAPRISRPTVRRLRIFALDPSLSRKLDSASVSYATLKVPWEVDSRTGADSLKPGPIGEYIEVVDIDPASGLAYPPVDLNHPYLLAQDGLQPSEGNPQFHQQMAYAVAMTTVRNFERALGRTAFWAPRPGAAADNDYVPRLRIYPHAMREENAYYNPDKVALLFGYFPDYAQGGALVFTSLSHDIVAHETTHALLDGMNRSLLDATNPDVLAFHEAFADIVALFQHFTFPEILRYELARTRGDLGTRNWLAQLAQEFGEATGARGALRDALGGPDEYGAWQRHVPSAQDLANAHEPHKRGAILVAAVFDAFESIFRQRSGDLIRIATGGSGVLPAGALHPDLINRLAAEAVKSAQHVLNICIRALDYCPPVDLTFGDYLRALITADADVVPDDERGYRIAFIDAFRRRGIFPAAVRSLSDDSLRWSPPAGGVKLFSADMIGMLRNTVQVWDLSNDRAHTYKELKRVIAELQAWLGEHAPSLNTLERLGFGPLHGDAQPLRVRSLRPGRRLSPYGESFVDLVLELMRDQSLPDGTWQTEGVTLVIDAETLQVRYAIPKAAAAMAPEDIPARPVMVREIGDALARKPKPAPSAARAQRMAGVFARLHAGRDA